MPSDEIERYGDLGRVNAELDDLVRQAAELTGGTGSTGHDLVPGAGQPVDATKAAIIAQRGQVEAVRAAISAKMEEQRRLMEIHRDRVRAALAPLEEMSKKLREGLEAINLYMGFDQDIMVLTQGEPAPPTEPISVRQLVLSMDEECAVAAEQGGIDAVTMEQFDSWLLEDPAHLDQVLPEQRGAVALVPRRTRKDYGGDPWVQTSMDRANTMTYLLVRNGANLYKIYLNFMVGERLVPRSDEFTKIFTDRVYDDKTGSYITVRLDPGSPAWERAQKTADARQRHFMKVALILQGLVDRTEVFHPLPAPQVSLLHHESYDAGHARVIADGEKAIGTGDETFEAWQIKLNSQLRPGMRIVGNFGLFNGEFQNANAFNSKMRYGHSRLYPHNAEYPETGTIYELTQRATEHGPWGSSQAGLAFNYDRQEQVWARGRRWAERRELRQPKTRARCIVLPTDSFIIAYDLAEIPDMEKFLRARTERYQYLSMFPVLKAAIRAKKQEQQQEQPFRQMLAGVLAQRNKITVVEAEQAVPDLVRWYKYANRYHRPLVLGTDLPTSPVSPARTSQPSKTGAAHALEQITAEHRRRLAQRPAAQQEPQTVETLLRRHDNAVLIGRKRDGRYVVLLAADQRPVYVHRLEYKPSDLDRPALETRWRIPGSEAARYRVLYSSERWAGWRLGASPADHPSGPQIDRMVQDLAGLHNQTFAVALDLETHEVTAWCATAMARWDPGRPLSSKHTDVDIVGWDHRWETRAGRIQLDRGTDHHYSLSWDRTHYPWGDNPGSYSWERRQVCWRDPKLVEEIFASHAAYQEFMGLPRSMGRQADQAMARIKEQWEHRAEQAAQQEHLERYGDITGWDKQRNPNIRFPYPLNQLAGEDPRSSSIGIFVRHLVEAGLLVEGVTVGQAQAKLEKATGRKFPLPEDILTFKI
jgi:hypothetical protein